MANTVLNRKAKASIRVEKSFNLTSAAGAGKIQSKPRLDPPQSIEPEKNTDTTFSRSSAQDDIAAAVARVKAKRESAKETALTSAANNNNEECK